MRSRFFQCIIVLMLALSAAAQTGGPTPPDENATLADLQNWLTKNIKKSSSLRVYFGFNTTEQWRISDPLFDGCKFTYTDSWVRRYLSPPPPAGGRDLGPGNPTPGPIIDSSVRGQTSASRPTKKIVTIDFRHLGSAAVFHTAPVDSKNALIVQLKTKDNTAAVTITDEKGKTVQGFANVIVKKEAAFPIKEVFLRVIGLCQAEK